MGSASGVLARMTEPARLVLFCLFGTNSDRVAKMPFADGLPMRA